MVWFNKKEDTTEIKQKLILVESRISALEQKNEILTTNINSLRGLINRKIAGSGPADVEKDSGILQTGKDLNTFSAFNS